MLHGRVDSEILSLMSVLGWGMGLPTSLILVLSLLVVMEFNLLMLLVYSIRCARLENSVGMWESLNIQ